MSDSVAAMQAKVHATIPLSREMGFQITRLSGDGIICFAPLEPNINIHGTGFAGSLYSLAILSAWSYASYLVEHHSLHAELVVGSGKIRYTRPIETDIECRCSAGQADIDAFLDTLTSGRRAKIELEVDVNHGSAVVKALMVATPHH